ncbi:MAG TPA: hypothetical protein VHM27_16620 [Rhizomicrobium sp.]|nr:hypothetical protein [Rhizomicrobium sp.]
MASDNSAPALEHPFLRPGLGPAELRRTNAGRAASWAAVGLLHVLLFTVLVITIRPFANFRRPVIETILMFPSQGNNPDAPPLRTINPDVQNPAPPMFTTAPLAIPKPIVPPDSEGRAATPGDILGAVGRELACSAGSWEHLSSAERRACGGIPWRGMRMPNGSLVMIPRGVLPRLREPPPDEGLRITGNEQIQRDVQTGQMPGQGGCPILQHTPCLHPSQGGINILGGN